MEFKLDGKKIKPNIGYNVEHFKKQLDKLADGELITVAAFAEKFNLKAGYVRELVRKHHPENSLIIDGKVILGSSKTVKAYKNAVQD